MTPIVIDIMTRARTLGTVVKENTIQIFADPVVSGYHATQMMGVLRTSVVMVRHKHVKLAVVIRWEKAIGLYRS